MRAAHAWQRAKDAAARFAFSSGIEIDQRPAINVVADKPDWAIGLMAANICRGINSFKPNMASTTEKPGGLCGRIVHFGTRDLWLAWKDRLSSSNRIVVTCLHGNPDDSAAYQQSISRFLETVPRLAAIITSNRIMQERLLRWGVPSSLLKVIPLGVDVSLFAPSSDRDRAEARRQLNVPENHKCIGSFQKDGEGWDEGLIPKLVKGPDIFVDAVVRLSRKLPVFVLLTGPARGYVRKRLESEGIPYAHHVLSDYRKIVSFYHALDLYIVASREEGGPLALPEAMATGIPLVTTAVGMAPELVCDGENGMLVPSFDARVLADRAAEVLSDESLRRRMIQKGLETASRHDWSVLAKRHYHEVYHPLLGQLGW